MTYLDGSGELAGWKARLLDRIRDLASEQWRIARDNDLNPPWPQAPDPALDHVRAHLRDLHEQEHELVVRARASGIRSTDVDLAANVFVWGHRRAPVLEGENAVRAQLIDAIAADVWTLQHMAAIATDRRWRYRNDPAVPDTTERQHYEHNMSAIWQRAAATAWIAELTEREQAELWGLDERGWSTLFHETTYFYTDAQLEDRWRAYADPCAVTGVTNATNTVAKDLRWLPEPDRCPPSGQALMDQATDVLNAEVRALGSEDEYEEYRTDYFLGAVVPAAERDDRSHEGATDPDPEPSPVYLVAAAMPDNLDPVTHDEITGDVVESTESNVLESNEGPGL